MTRITRLASFLLIVLLTALPAVPARAETDPRPVLAVSGRAALEVPPDKVEITVGVSTQAPTSAEASRQNAVAMEQVLGAVKARLGGAGTLQSVGYRVNQRYEWDGKRNRPVGYTATNQVKVIMKEVSLAGPLLDDATQAGANMVYGPNWGLQDMSAARIRAQEAAFADALAQAQALAKAAGLALSELKSADFSLGDAPSSYLRAPSPAAARAPAPETQVEPGMINLSASVRCVWYLK